MGLDPIARELSPDDLRLRRVPSRPDERGAAGMSDEELPEDADRPEGEDAPDLPPPSTFAGKARKDAAGGDEREPDPADEQEDPPDEFAFDEDGSDEAEVADDAEPGAGSGSDDAEAIEPDADKAPDPSADAGEAPVDDTAV